ncbi:hypothetical protein [Pokkaliibacter plantistimulans]|uniref:hypothetical protein n=1 Tax=Pokkaliibacter plantistimulans TaxID=1635171 RepID=UPI0011B02AD7|nr:hypothetical protein [Pokkaliibacter plantistimulans]
MFLNCHDEQSTIQSLASIYVIPQSEIEEFFDSQDGYDMPHTDKIYVANEFFKKFGLPKENYETIWFHGTRTDNIQSISAHGLLPKSKIKPIIYSKLQSLCSGLIKSGTYPHSASYSTKQRVSDEGPFGFLIRDACLLAPGYTHSYISAPELVEDISGLLLGENFRQLVNRYHDSTDPYIVSFRTSSSIHALEHAIWYGYLTYKDVNILEDGDIEMCAYNASEEKISSDKIFEIEKISRV